MPTPISNDAWRHDDQSWHQHRAGVDDELLTEAEAAPYVPLAAPYVSTNALGVDTASYQGSPAWAQVAATRQFVYVKAGQGNGASYPTLDAQYQGATAAGMAVGLYWFADPSLSATVNADAFAAQINRLGAVAGHLPPCLDLETGTGNLSQWTQQFIARLRAQTGCIRVIIYSGASFFQNQIGESGLDQNVALWIASWGTPPGQPSYNSPRVALHQYSSTGQVAGVAGNVDLDWAIWPLSTLIPSEVPPVTNPPAASTPSGLTAEEHAMLVACYQQFSGSPTVGQWTGWPSWPHGSGRSLTAVDYMRQSDVLLNDIVNEIDVLKAAGVAVVSLSDVDVQRIATAVVGMLTQRLQS